MRISTSTEKIALVLRSLDRYTAILKEYHNLLRWARIDEARKIKAGFEERKRALNYNMLGLKLTFKMNLKADLADKTTEYVLHKYQIGEEAQCLLKQIYKIEKSAHYQNIVRAIKKKQPLPSAA